MTGSTHGKMGLITGIAITQLTGLPIFAVIAAFIGSLWPDIDHPRSWLGRYFKFLFLFLKGFIGYKSIIDTVIVFIISMASLFIYVLYKNLPLRFIYVFVVIYIVQLILWQFLFRFKPVKEFFHEFFAHRGLSHTLIGMVLFSLPIFFFTTAFKLPLYYNWFFLAGYFSHLFLDTLTERGVPYFWPFYEKHLAYKICTTQAREWVVRSFLLGILFWQCFGVFHKEIMELWKHRVL